MPAKLVNLTKLQLLKVNAAIKANRSCCICKARLTVPGGKKPGSSRFLTFEPISGTSMTWRDGYSGTMKIAVFCHTCGTAISKYADGLRKTNAAAKSI